MEYLHLQQLISAASQSTVLGYAPCSPMQRAMWYEYLCKQLVFMFFWFGSTSRHHSCKIEQYSSL